MKAHREAAEKAMSAKLRRLGAQGDMKFATKGQSHADGKTKGYATGGAVGGQDVDGMAPRPSLSRPSRSRMGGKKKAGGKGKTNVNVIVMSGAAPGGPDPMMKPPMPPMDAGPPMMPPKPPMPLPPGGAPGGPPMPMRKDGGRVHADEAQDKGLVKKMVHKHEKVMHRGAKLTKLKRGGRAC